MRPQGENHLAAGILVNEKEAEKIKWNGKEENFEPQYDSNESRVRAYLKG